MAKVTIYNQNHDEVGELDLDDSVFATEVKPHLLHMAVRKQRAAKRAGTHAVKRRADVSGGGRKPFKQKGTGRARQGTSRAAQMRGGGVVFGPEPRSYDFKMNKKEMRGALRSALSLRAGAGDLVVLDDLAFDAPKTKDFKAFLSAFGLGDALVVVDGATDATTKSARNLNEVTMLPSIGVNVYDVLNRKTLVITKSAVEQLTARLGGRA